MLAITRTSIHGEDALKTLIVLEQPVLPVELKATPALDGSSTILHSSTFWERKWDSIED